MAKKTSVYVDYAATTFVKPEVLDEMLPFFSVHFGNYSGIHEFSKKVRPALNQARKQLANLINAETDEIFITSGGTESDNWAIKGLALANPGKKHIVTSQIEHHAIINTCAQLEKTGYRITYLPVDKDGIVSPKDVISALSDDTLVVSIMTANNEIGTIEPICCIGGICKDHAVIFHTDAIQAFGSIPIDVKKMNIDMLSASAHKIYGPKGVGMLYIKKGLNLAPLL